ncbi:MAG TPA: hypothetical protein VFT98_13450 [Myxococcota bacterium]|nr:hypothetical protein [Myxococcota bacterium]
MSESAAAPRRRPPVLLAACAVGATLGVDALRRANELRLLGELDLVLCVQGALLIGLGVATALRPRAPLALAQLAVALWVYTGLAPVLGDLAAHGFASARIWLQPLPLAAFAFFPLAFFGWRALARGRA